MEPPERISEERSSLSGLYTAEEANFMNQLLGNCSVPEQLYGDFNLGIPSAVWPGHESTIVSVKSIKNSSYFPAGVTNTNFVCCLQGSSSSADSSDIFPTANGGNYSSSDPVTNFGYMSMGFALGDSKFSPYRVQGNDSQQINENTDEELGLDPGPADKNLQTHEECEVLVSEPEEEDKSRSLENSGRRSMSSIEVRKNKRNVKYKKNPKSASISNTEEDRSPGLQGQTLSSCCSEDDSNASQELNGGASSSLSPKDSTAPKSNGKSRSNKGPATDPQSVYARLDISTMIEEVVQYVKFLQLQIKLLSSDDLWVYAPIAYNGTNIGLDLNITPTKQPIEMRSTAMKEDAAI